MSSLTQLLNLFSSVGLVHVEQVDVGTWHHGYDKDRLSDLLISDADKILKRVRVERFSTNMPSRSRDVLPLFQGSHLLDTLHGLRLGLSIPMCNSLLVGAAPHLRHLHVTLHSFLIEEHPTDVRVRSCL